MHIVVSIKQVPDSARIRVHPISNTIMRDRQDNGDPRCRLDSTWCRPANAPEVSSGRVTKWRPSCSNY